MECRILDPNSSMMYHIGTNCSQQDTGMYMNVRDEEGGGEGKGGGGRERKEGKDKEEKEKEGR